MLEVAASHEPNERTDMFEGNASVSEHNLFTASSKSPPRPAHATTSGVADGGGKGATLPPGKLNVEC